jgi:carbamoyl-phosphate synthase small subunit
MFGVEEPTSGEVVFHTGMTGYQEILTDPSYYGQIVVMTYPHIGNYGVNEEDIESRDVFVNGFIVYECSRIASNPRAEETLDDYLKEHDIPGLEGVDTRAITRRIREEGAMPGIIHPEPEEEGLESLKEEAAQLPTMKGQNLIPEVTRDEPESWLSGLDESFGNRFPGNGSIPADIVAIDYGIKNNILRNLKERFDNVDVVPSDTSAEEILDRSPDGIFLSNGPGDPAALEDEIDTLRELVDAGIPMYGVCLGQQLLARALGAETYKLKFGHHGANHPVKDLRSDEIEITSQNHGFAVTRESAQEAGFDVTHINLNDETVEGMLHNEKPVACVQFHPEAAPGPHDSSHLFSDFADMVRDEVDTREVQADG